MANIPPVVSSGDNAHLISKTDNNSKTADYDAFLSLLVAQLKNQDPTNPSDPAQFLSQLASFSSVEQQIKTNEHLTSMLSMGNAGEAVQLIGATVASADGSTEGVVASVTLNNSGVIANLEDGSTVQMGEGARILSR
ncbi:flagellar hook assembly protein FlgD [Salaquimonas pukyongi]|uniref:flagellar hook assembly protein FlgD n=1 Tax=Salaquimonas pukyongi TaxID=2712698 RepID=UPI001FCD9FD3|nr:flagellar hook assembly protein FlgD [Salaquimonas pukyongi]